MSKQLPDRPAPFGRTHADRKYLEGFGLDGERRGLGERLTVDGFKDDQRVLVEGMGRALAGAIILETRGVNHNGAFAVGWRLVAELKSEDGAGFPKEELGVVLGHERAEELAMMWGLWGKMRRVADGEELADGTEAAQIAQLTADNETLRGENERLSASVEEKNAPRRYEVLNEPTKKLLGKFLGSVGVEEQRASEIVQLMADKVEGCKADGTLTVEDLLVLAEIEREKLVQFLMKCPDETLTPVGRGSDLVLNVIWAKRAEEDANDFRLSRERRSNLDKAKGLKGELLRMLFLREKKADE